MKAKDLVPGFVKSMLRPLYQVVISSSAYKKAKHHPKSRKDLSEFWSNPNEGNKPANYLEGEVRSRYLIDILSKRSKPESGILEIGCNVGRNLHFLQDAGFTKLTGIELNASAVEMLKTSYPDLAAKATIINRPIEEVIHDFKDRQFDLVFTMAVLEHIHFDSEWIFAEITRITHTLVTIEDEYEISWRHFPRKYKQIFESLGMRQIEEFPCRDIEGFGANFRARVFIHG